MEFVYPALNDARSIRLMIPSHKQDEQQLSYTLQVASIDTSARFSALSYVWGPTALQQIVILDGHRFPITHNLHQALWQVHHASKHEATYFAQPVAIWADQICINQKNLGERSSQVAMMAELYTKAERVFVSLGESPTAAHAFEAITNLQPHIRASLKLHKTFNAMPKLSAEEIRNLSLLDWKSIQEMLAATWFSRVWVVQEAALGRNVKVLYGSHQFAWRSLMNVLGWLCYPAARLYWIHDLTGWTFYQIWVSFDRKDRNLDTSFRSLPVLDLLCHTSYAFKATIPHDHLYAFLGHPSFQTQESTGSSPSPIIQPNYSLAPQAVYLDFAKAWLEYSRQPYLLSCVDHSDLSLTCGGDGRKGQPYLELPSWCPRWNYQPLGGIRLSTERGAWGYRSSDTTEFHHEISAANELRVRGHIFDTVVHTFERLSELSDPREIVTDESKFTKKEFVTMSKLGYLAQCVLNWMKAAETCYRRREDEDTLAAFAATITTASWTPEETPFARRMQLAKFRMCAELALTFQTDLEHALVPLFWDALKVVSRACNRRDPLESDLTAPEAVGIVRTAEMVMGPRRLFVTRGGRIGIGPEIAIAGDVCCIVSGAEVPYVLRSCGPFGYLLVGESYVDGTMNGEAVKSFGEQGDTWKTIVLQ